MYDIFLKKKGFNVAALSYKEILKDCNPYCYYNNHNGPSKMTIGFFNNGKPCINELFSTEKEEFEEFFGEHIYMDCPVICLIQQGVDLKGEILQDIVPIGNYLYLQAGNFASDKFKKIGLNAENSKNIPKHIGNNVIAPLLRNCANPFLPYVRWILMSALGTSNFILSDSEDTIFHLKGFRHYKNNEKNEGLHVSKYVGYNHSNVNEFEHYFC